MGLIGFKRHNHDECIAQAVRAVDEQCVRDKLQLTPVRRKVLEILLFQHRALGAYDILEQLKDEGFGSQPPVAYRALDFLVKHGFAHKIERLNAFIACTHPGENHEPAFLICRHCAAVAEATNEPVLGNLGAAAQDAGFTIEQTCVELEGVCAKCQSTSDV